ncbi:MAG: acetyl-CoA carboxylase, carboxyltransferase subunit beta [Candidatus Aminicenantes bacterium]|nr:acetyl-CoA carboxylase, carboxyltransferase subunit beta [Candidatus Aminicenantes bacterium]
MSTNLWTRCNNCQRILFKEDILENLSVCPACSFHFRLSAAERLAMLFDDGTFDIVDHDICSQDPLHFVDKLPYAKRLEDNQRKTDLPEAAVTAVGNLGGIRTVICALDFSFMGGSVGSVLGEKITRAAERALAERLPLVIVSVSGGMRMQEGLLSLMQMAKTSAALSRLDEARLPYISILADPTSGGTTASWAMLGDINISEPNAFVGFAGPVVIEQTIKEKLPKGFQRSEFVLKHGFLDDIVPRKALRPFMIKALRLLLNRPQ